MGKASAGLLRQRHKVTALTPRLECANERDISHVLLGGEFAMTNAMTAQQVAQTTFVCSPISKDAGEDLQRILVRKEAERLAGSGEFWWGLGAALGDLVEK